MPEVQSKRSTLHDVAALAGVSYQTVSRVINRHPNVAEKTRAQVLDAIRHLTIVPTRQPRCWLRGAHICFNSLCSISATTTRCPL